ncbi:carbonic anhydrase family protein, partial [Novosphingobium sp. 1949]
PATSAPPPASPAPVAHGDHWGYAGAQGPDHWGDLSDEYRLCKTGHMQSPVDLGAADVTAHFSVSASYKSAPLTILNNGHTVQVNFPEGSTLASGISRYKLLQVHFHTPSEETIYGLHYPMVAHFVHVDYAGNLAVLGILFEEGAPNPELAKIIKAAPAHAEAAHPVAGVTLDPAKLLPETLGVYRYEGSLTTPPCSEGVRWHVATHRVTASADQIAAIHAIIGDNARPIQPRYGRLLIAGAD